VVVEVVVEDEVDDAGDEVEGVEDEGDDALFSASIPFFRPSEG
jgi:hypothetical protein